MILSAALAMMVAAGTVGVRRVPVSSPAVDATQAAADFEKRVQNYVELRRALGGTEPAIAVSNDYAQVLAAIDALAAKIRAARKDARPGDIFTPAVECVLREIIATSLEGFDTDALLASLNEENPPDVVLVPQINGRWPVGVPLGSMPPKLLADLPPLPDDLQYRFLGGDLVLWDAQANLVVDVIRRALP
jgi:hypothetical protein